jgi:hypothetical protein
MDSSALPMDERHCEGRADRPRVVITVNGPGEVSSWLLPFATELKQQVPAVEICVALMPCVFSTGAELDVIRRLGCVDAVCGVRETLALALRGKIPPGFRRGNKVYGSAGFVMHLGGEAWLSLAIARRLGLPCHAYVEKPFAIQRLFDRVFFTNFRTIPAAKMGPRGMMIGEMMIDAARLRCPKRPARRDRRVTVGLYPGSREKIAAFTLPFLAVVAERMAREREGYDFILAKADFLSLAFLKSIPPIDDGRPLEATTLRYSETDGAPSLETEGGLQLPVLSPAEAAGRIDLAVTLPGTNTAEMAALGIPMVVFLPTWWADIAPLPGLAGHVGRVPLIGKWIKRLGAHLYLRNLGFTAHPNRRSHRLVVPEVVGPITSADVTAAIYSMVDGGLAPIEAELRAIMGEPGATKRLVNALRPELEGASAPQLAA